MDNPQYLSFNYSLFTVQYDTVTFNVHIQQTYVRSYIKNLEPKRLSSVLYRCYVRFNLYLPKCNGVLERRPIICKCVKLSILPTRIYTRRQVSDKLFIELPSAEAFGEIGAIDTHNDGFKPSL